MNDSKKICLDFNSLPRLEKWNKWKEQKGQWACKHCGSIMEDGPNRAHPFHGASVCCSECDKELTRRTGGGQMDPFEWIFIPLKYNVSLKDQKVRFMKRIVKRHGKTWFCKYQRNFFNHCLLLIDGMRSGGKWASSGRAEVSLENTTPS